MVNPINDNVLGNRFWLVNDLGKLDQVEQPPAAAPDGAPKKVNPESTIFTFAASGGDAMATSAINKAELFASQHTLTEDEVALENQRAESNLRQLIGEKAAVDALVDEIADLYVQHFQGTELADAKEVCRTALRKLMATREFDERARLPLEGRSADFRQLGEAGLAAVKNAVLGLAHMLQEGEISERAVVVLADGNYYDAANRTDLLRLSAESAKQVKKLFIGESRYTRLIEQCKEFLANMPNLSEEERQQIQRKIDRLRVLADEAIRLRTAATAGIKTDYQLAKSGKASDSQAFQEKQLDQIRNSLRAFRYDLDMARGTKMTGMEWVRRKADNFFSASVGHRITRADYLAMQEADRVFNDLLGEVQRDTFDGAQVNPQDKADIYSKASGDVDWADKVKLDNAAEAATRLSHLTNDRIRYHYSGVENRAAENYAAIEDELGNIAEDGGMRTVTFRAGVDALFELDLLAAGVKAKAGVAGEVTAKIQVDNASGTVKVTYSVGGMVQAGASTQVGVDPDEKDSEAPGGLGAKVSGEASAGLTRSVTKTYANLEEFARTASRLNLVMTPRPREVFYAWAKAALKGIGHLFTLGATVTGFRIHRSQMDQVAYGAELRNRNVMGKMGGVFLKKRNIEILEERTDVTFKTGGRVEAEGGLYFQNDGEMGSNLDFTAQAGAEYSREISAKGKMYTSFVKSLDDCTAKFLSDQFDAEKNHEDIGSDWKTALSGLIKGVQHTPSDAEGIAKGLAGLTTKLTELEESTIGKDEKDTQFWRGFAAKARLLAIATAFLTKCANALDDAVPGATEAKRAAKAAGEYIVPRLANPVVKVPEKIFRDEFFSVFELTKPRTSKTSVFVNLAIDPFGSAVDGKLDDWGIGEDTKDTFKGGTLNTAAKAGADFVKETANLSGKIQLRYTKENKVSKHVDVRPWMNTTGKKTFEVNLPVSLPMRIALDTIARYYCKKVAGLDEAESQKWAKEFYEGFTDGFKQDLESVIIDGTVPFLDMTLGEAAEKSPTLKALLGGVSFLKDKYDADYAFTDDTYKMLRFEVDGDGRFAGFALVDGYDTKGKLELTPKNFFSVTFSLTSQTLVNDFMVMPRPKVNDLLKRADDFAQAGNPEGFKNFLARNKNGVVRLLQAGKDKAGDAERAGDKYWKPDCDNMAAIINECRQLLASHATKNTVLGNQAKTHMATFDAVAQEVQNQGELSDEQALDLAARFFTAAARVYTLAAMDEAAA